jgi:trigger factor
VKVTVNKVDDANIIVSGTIENSAVEENINKMAVQAGKEMKVDGFRKGKVPAHVVKKLHGEKLAQDAEGEVLRELIDAGMKEAGINPADMLGQPTFKKYEKTDSGIDVEVEISTRPVFEAEGHMDVLPAFERPTASEKEVEEKLNEIA